MAILIFEGVEFNTMQIVGPLIVPILTMIGTTLIYKLLFSWLPKRLYSARIGLVALFGAYLGAIPMDLGFHTYFQ